jgi:hypothetical protein
VTPSRAHVSPHRQRVALIASTATGGVALLFGLAFVAVVVWRFW